MCHGIRAAAKGRRRSEHQSRRGTGPLGHWFKRLTHRRERAQGRVLTRRLAREAAPSLPNQ